jgi:hypothetical protein
MIDSGAAAPPLLLQLILEQQTNLTGIDVLVATKEALKMKLFRRDSSDESSVTTLERETLLLP